MQSWLVLLSACCVLFHVSPSAAEPTKKKQDIVAKLRGGLPPSQIEQALATIVSAKRRDAVPAVMELLQHRRSRVRAIAVDALAALGTARAQSPLLFALDDPASEVREAAARALGEVGTRRALAPLLAAHEQGVRQALLSIGKLARPAHVRQLLERSDGKAVTTLAPALAIMLERKDFPLAGKLLIIREVADHKDAAARQFLVDWLSHFKTEGHPRLRDALFEAIKQLDDHSSATSNEARRRTAKPARQSS